MVLLNKSAAFDSTGEHGRAMVDSTSRAAAWLLLVAVLSATDGELAAAISTGHSGLQAAEEGSQAQSARSLLVVGGRNDPQVRSGQAANITQCQM